jgi:hypothetical protein
MRKRKAIVIDYVPASDKKKRDKLIKTGLVIGGIYLAYKLTPRVIGVIVFGSIMLIAIAESCVQEVKAVVNTYRPTYAQTVNIHREAYNPTQSVQTPVYDHAPVSCNSNQRAPVPLKKYQNNC